MDRSYNFIKNRESNKTVSDIKVFQASENSSLKEALEDVYYEKLLENGCCAICSTQTSKICSNCSIHYCSDDCQMLDWPKHRSICEKKLSVNQFLSNSNFESSANGSDTEITNLSTENKWKHSLRKKSNKSPLNKEKMSTVNDFRSVTNDYRNKLSASNCGSQDNNKTLQNSMPKKNKVMCTTKEENATPKINVFHNESSENEINEGEECIKDKKTKEENSEFKSLPENEESNCTTEIPNELEKLKIDSSKINDLVIGDMIKVKFTFNELHEETFSLYWVIKEQDIPKFEEIQNFLSKNYETLTDTIPQKNHVYGCIHNGKWYRGKVISTEPSLRIHNIDIGILYDYNSKYVKMLPPDLESLKGLAFPIKLLKKSAENFANRIKCFCDAVVEVVSVNSKGIYQVELYESKHPVYVAEKIEKEHILEETKVINIVEKTEETKAIQDVKQNSEVKTDEIRRSVIDDLREGYTGVFHLMHISNDELNGCLIPENIEDAIDCHKKLGSSRIAEMPIIESDIGDMVMVVNNDNHAHRGIVISKPDKNHYEVFLIDCGYVIQTSKIFEVPQKLRNSMELACKMTMKNREILDMQIFELNSVFMFEIKDKVEEGKWNCILKCDADEEGYVEMLMEKSEKPKSIIKPHKEFYIPLESECRIIISALGGGNTVYVRRIDGSWETDLEEMVVDINLWIKNQHINEDNIQYPLQVGDLVCAKFQADKVYYRAKILSIAGDNVKIRFVDYGNVEEMCMNDLRPLKAEFHDTIIFARKISLYNPKEKIISETGLKYLKDLITNSTELIMTFHNDSSDFVILSERDSFFAINEFIFDEEINVKEEKLISCSEISDSVLSFPVFSVGETNLIILHVNEEEFMESGLFWASDPLTSEFEYIMGELSIEISNYSCSTKSYSPKVGEFCIAQFEGGWYRGIVISKSGQQFKIFFIDFGNICLIESDLIRKKQYKFFQNAPAIVKCIFSGFENQDNDKRQSALDFVKKNINEYLNCVIVEKVVNNSCFIRFPSFEQKSSI